MSATLSLTRSWTRRSTAASELPVQDTVTAAQSAIATSTANADGGAFELGFNDAHYLPFEGAGAISSWRLDLPSAMRPFSYSTISDVVMHISYTARDGGAALKESVEASLPDALNDLNSLVPEDATMSRLFSLRREFPDAWNQLVLDTDEPTQSCTLQLSKRHFPSFLDYTRQPSDLGTVEVKPITLNISSLLAHLSPTGPMPSDAATILLNQQPWTTDTLLGIPKFDLTNAPDALPVKSIDNTNVVECTLTITGVRRAEDWNDVYLLMDYEVHSDAKLARKISYRDSSDREAGR